MIIGGIRIFFPILFYFSDAIRVFLFAFEFFYPSLSIDKFCFAGKKRMAGGANVYLYLRQSGAGNKSVSANTGYFAVVVVFRVNVFFHNSQYYISFICFLTRAVCLGFNGNNMKKNLVLLGLMFCFLVGVAPVFAQQMGTASGQPRQSAIDRSLQFKEKVATKSAEMRGSVEERKQKFQENLQNFKDERKKAIVERLHRRMINVNKKVTDKLLSKLERLEAILVKIESRAQKKGGSEADVGAVYSGIEMIEGRIAVLKGKIQEQAGKTYDFDISDEQDLRSQVHAEIKSEQTDLKSLNEELMDIRREMLDLMQMLANIRAAGWPATGSAIIME